MKKFFDKQTVFIVGAIIIGLLLNKTNCTPDPYCDPDPLYGGCSESCDYGTTIQWATKSFGIWVILNLGAFIGIQNLKKKEYLKEFFDKEGLKYTVRTIDEEWKIEDEKHEKEFQKLLKTMESKSKI